MKRIPNTFGLDVKATRWLEYHSEEELARWIAEGVVGIPYLHIGGGSNLLFLRDYEGTILHSCINGTELTGESDGQVYVRVGSGVVWDDFVARCVSEGWYGAENLSGIPGEVGAAAVQNIGAYGVEVKDLIRSVETIDISGTKRIYQVDECCYAYRDSLFKRTDMKRVFVTHVNFTLSKREHYSLDYGSLRQEVQKAGQVNLTVVRQAVFSIRNSKLPDPARLGNAGSFFKNPIVPQAVCDALLQAYPHMPSYPAGSGQAKLSAGWLIEQCGWKGRKLGNAGVYDKQALVLVNHGGATGCEIAALAEAVQAAVQERFGVRITPEVNYIG